MDQDKDTIECVGKDSKLHKCLPEAKKTLCGVEILSKKLGKDDLMLPLYLFNFGGVG